jgi:hypothetical protein
MNPVTNLFKDYANIKDYDGVVRIYNSFRGDNTTEYKMDLVYDGVINALMDPMEVPKEYVGLHMIRHIHTELHKFKNISSDGLAGAITSGDFYVDSAIDVNFTGRLAKVAKLKAYGYTIKEIAKKLKKSRITIIRDLKEIKEQLKG